MSAPPSSRAEGTGGTSSLETARVLGEVSRSHVHHLFSNFRQLDRSYPGAYPLVIVRGEGQYLYDAAGRRLLDAAQHLGACAIGHGRREMGEAMAEQVGKLEFCALDNGVTHEVVARLALRLTEIVPVEDPAFYFSSSGSEANETALKLARVFHAARGDHARKKFIARNASYHGSGFGAAAVTGNPGLREPFAPLVPGVVRSKAPSPGRCGYCEIDGGCTLRCASEIERIIRREGPETVAALIAEPISMHQGVVLPDPGYWPLVREICNRFGVLLVFDEVVTGFGRTGLTFASEHFGIRPDVITIAKALTSSYVPMGAAVVAGHVSEVFAETPLPHSNTHSGHPVACAAALANLDIIEREGLVERAASLGAVLREELDATAEAVPEVFRTSSIGLLASAEFRVQSLSQGWEIIGRLRHLCLEEGNVLLRGACDGEVGAVIFYPPLVVDEEDIRNTYALVRRVLPRVLKELGA